MPLFETGKVPSVEGTRGNPTRALPAAFDEARASPVPLRGGRQARLEAQDHMRFRFKWLVEDRHPAAGTWLPPRPKADRRHRLRAQTRALEQMANRTRTIEGTV